MQDTAATVRACLHCAAPSDPRLAVPDSKQKGPAGGRGRVVPEARLVRELGAALQASDAAGGGFLKAIGGLAGVYCVPYMVCLDLRAGSWD